MIKVFRILFVLFLLFPVISNASIFADIWGVATDPLKIGKAGNSAVEAANRVSSTLLSLQQDTDKDIRYYLNRFQGIIRQIEQAVSTERQATIESLIVELHTLADRMDITIRKIFVEAECAVEVTLNDTLRRAFGGNIRFLSDDKLELVLPIKVRRDSSISRKLFGEYQDDVIEIDLAKSYSPSKIYEIIRDRHLASLSRITPNTRARDVVLLYADIARFARQARCHYRTDSYGLLLTREYITFDELANAWVTAVNIKIPTEIN